MNIKVTLYRKLLAGCITIFATTALFASSTIFGTDGEIEYGGAFIYMSIVIGVFLIPFTLVYLMPVSLLIEHMYFKKETFSMTLYIGIHALVGTASFFILQEMNFLLFGIVAAGMFAYIDRRIEKIGVTRNLVKKILLTTTGLYAGLTVFFAYLYG